MQGSDRCAELAEWIGMPEVRTNIQVLKPSRKAPQPGDVFAVGLPDDTFIYGRVISTTAKWTRASGAGPANLIYLFRERSNSKQCPDRSELRPDRLLVPPIMTNRLPWSRGYFETLVHVPLERDDVLSQHCFRFPMARIRYFDDFGNELPSAVEPVGEYALHSFRTIDDEISDALGIPKVPD